MQRLKSEIRVQAWVRQCAAQGLIATVARKGEGESGAVILKVNRFAAGCEVFTGVSAPDGGQAWMRACGPKPVSERDADAYLARQAKYDPDVWVLEIEDPKAQFTLDGPILDV
ncbi:MAG: DUF1491 family protein [Rhodospirillaceae bacterium]|nr:DUF1491 family protein [Rhodospirillaceae bacterium]